MFKKIFFMIAVVSTTLGCQTSSIESDRLPAQDNQVNGNVFAKDPFRCANELWILNMKITLLTERTDRILKNIGARNFTQEESNEIKAQYQERVKLRELESAMMASELCSRR